MESRLKIAGSLTICLTTRGQGCINNALVSNKDKTFDKAIKVKNLFVVVSVIKFISMKEGKN